MRILNEREIAATYKMPEALRDVANVLKAKAAGKVENPLRTVIEFPEEHASVLYMPCADLENELMSMKAVTIFPNNPLQGKNTTQGVILLSDATNGDHLALLNASYLTRLRTGALSGIATDYLARPDSHILTVIGTGKMAFEQVLGVLEVRDIVKINLVNPTVENAERFAQALRDYPINPEIEIVVAPDRSKAVQEADIINCATRSKTPVFDGKDIQLGTHVNGVGSYLPDMQEVDFHFITRAAQIVVDDFHGATEEAGEFIHAVEKEGWSFDKISGELQDLISGKIAGREDGTAITFFKSVGSAYFDLAVAQGVYHSALAEDVGIDVEI